jgi:hypothetical protein
MYILDIKMSWTDALKEYAKKNGKWVVPKKDSVEYAEVARIHKALKEAKEAPKVEEKPKKEKKVKVVEEVKEVVKEVVDKPKGNPKVLRERQIHEDKLANNREATRKMRIELLERQLAEEKAKKEEEEKKPKKEKKVVVEKKEPVVIPPSATAPPVAKRRGRAKAPSGTLSIENKDITLSFT